jgi:hypothetical protein
MAADLSAVLFPAVVKAYCLHIPLGGMEATRFILVHLVVPALGFLIFLKICRDIRKKEIPHPPYFPIFALFFGYGGWLMQLLTVLFWYISGMMILGYFFLLFIMPLVILVCITWLYTNPSCPNITRMRLKAATGIWPLRL